LKIRLDLIKCDSIRMQIRLDLDGWTDVQKGNAVLGIQEGSLTAIYASHVRIKLPLFPLPLPCPCPCPSSLSLFPLPLPLPLLDAHDLCETLAVAKRETGITDVSPHTGYLTSPSNLHRCCKAFTTVLTTKYNRRYGHGTASWNRGASYTCQFRISPPCAGST
jgi:hypothetical protein